MTRKEEKPVQFTRREFIRLTAAGAIAAAFPAATGCTGASLTPKLSVDVSKGILLTNVNIVDVTRGTIIQNGHILLEKDKIASMGEGEGPAETPAVRVDMDSLYFIPGLMDAHCHTTLTSAGEFRVSTLMANLRQLERNYTQNLVNGVTTVRDLGAMPGNLHKYLKRIQQKKMLGPRVLYCNAITNIKGGHPDIDPQDVSMFAKPAEWITGAVSLWFEDTEELKEKMARNVENGASFIKLTMDDVSLMCGKDRIPVYSDEHLATIFDFAQKHELPVSAHIHRKFGFSKGLAWGLQSMEHTIDEPLKDSEILEMSRKNISIVPTMVVAQMLAAEEAYHEVPSRFRNDFIDNERAIRRNFLNTSHDDFVEPVIHEINREALEAYRVIPCTELYERGKMLVKTNLYFNILKYGPDNLKKMHQAGVLIGCGTDAGIPYVYHGMLFKEMEMLYRIGFSLGDVLKFATINNAKILGIEDRAGTIEKGKVADMVGLKENPLQNPQAFRTPEMVFQNGMVVAAKDNIRKRL